MVALTKKKSDVEDGLYAVVTPGSSAHNFSWVVCDGPLKGDPWVDWQARARARDNMPYKLRTSGRAYTRGGAEVKAARAVKKIRKARANLNRDQSVVR